MDIYLIQAAPPVTVTVPVCLYCVTVPACAGRDIVLFVLPVAAAELLLRTQPRPGQLHHLPRQNAPAGAAEQGRGAAGHPLDGQGGQERQGLHPLLHGGLQGAADTKGQHRPTHIHRERRLPHPDLPLRPR